RQPTRFRKRNPFGSHEPDMHKSRTSGHALFWPDARYYGYAQCQPTGNRVKTKQVSLMLGERRVNVPKAASTRRPQIKPKLGQHFLAGEEYALRIVDALGDVSQSTVLEIGPGRGIITALLANRVRRLIAVELDRVLAA